MCGRFTLQATPDELAEIFTLAEPPEWRPRYNIAPTQAILGIKLNDEQKRVGDLFRWGLIPSWADDPKIGNRLINAQGETARVKPSFRSAFKSRRCLIVADGFYEWKAEETGKQPLWISKRNAQPFAFAALWERWSAGAEVIKSATIITTAANALMQSFHQRMPVILAPEAYDTWLSGTPDEAERLLQPYTADDLVLRRVSTLVNNPRNESAACVEEVVSGGR